MKGNCRMIQNFEIFTTVAEYLKVTWDNDIPTWAANFSGFYYYLFAFVFAF